MVGTIGWEYSYIERRGWMKEIVNLLLHWPGLWWLISFHVPGGRLSSGLSKPCVYLPTGARDGQNVAGAVLDRLRQQLVIDKCDEIAATNKFVCDRSQRRGQWSTQRRVAVHTALS